MEDFVRGRGGLFLLSAATVVMFGFAVFVLYKSVEDAVFFAKNGVPTTATVVRHTASLPQAPRRVTIRSQKEVLQIVEFDGFTNHVALPSVHPVGTKLPALYARRSSQGASLAPSVYIGRRGESVMRLLEQNEDMSNLRTFWVIAACFALCWLCLSALALRGALRAVGDRKKLGCQAQAFVEALGSAGGAVLEGKDKRFDLPGIIGGAISLFSGIALTFEQKDAFSRCAGLPQHVWTHEHETTFALACLHHLRDLGPVLPGALGKSAGYLRSAEIPPISFVLSADVVTIMDSVYCNVGSGRIQHLRACIRRFYESFPDLTKKMRNNLLACVEARYERAGDEEKAGRRERVALFHLWCANDSVSQYCSSEAIGGELGTFNLLMLQRGLLTLTDGDEARARQRYLETKHAFPAFSAAYAKIDPPGAPHWLGACVVDFIAEGVPDPDANRQSKTIEAAGYERLYAPVYLKTLCGI